MTANGTLRVDDLHAGYGAIEVVHGVGLEVHPGETVCLLGRNGAGKTTTLSAIAGSCRDARGSIRLGERELRGLSAARVAGAGVAFVPEGHRIFRSLSVGENLRIGGFLRRRDPAAISADLSRMLELFPPLIGREKQVAGQLSGGEQQMVALAQALMTAPRVLILDEPSAGLGPLIVDAIYAAVRQLRDEGLALLIVEQAVERALRESDRAYVMEGGRVVLSGNAAELADDKRVAEIVLGEPTESPAG
jgi:branched-chain amino acid transport system ATP-binding protein